MRPTHVILMALLALGSTSAYAQNNAAPLKTMERARSYAITNRSSDTIVSAEATMTNGDRRSLTWNEPLPPEQVRNIAVPSQDCLASMTVRLKSGRTLNSSGRPDCRDTRIRVSDSGISIGSAASNRPPLRESP